MATNPESYGIMDELNKKNYELILIVSRTRGIDITGDAFFLHTAENPIRFGINSISKPSWSILCLWGLPRPPVRSLSLYMASDLGIQVSGDPTSQNPIRILCWSQPEPDTLRFLGLYAARSWGLAVTAASSSTFRPPALFAAVDAAMTLNSTRTAADLFQSTLLPERLDVPWLYKPTTNTASLQTPQPVESILDDAATPLAVENKLVLEAASPIQPLPDVLIPAGHLANGRSIGLHLYGLSNSSLGDILLSADWSRYQQLERDGWFCPRYRHILAYTPRGPQEAQSRFSEPLSQGVVARHRGLTGKCRPIAIYGWELTTWTCIDIDNHGGHRPISRLLQLVRCLKSIYPQAVLEARYAVNDPEFQEQHAPIALWKRGSRILHRNPADRRTYVAGVHCWLNWGRWQVTEDVHARVRKVLKASGFAEDEVDLFPQANHAISLPLRRCAQEHAEPSYELVDDDLLPVVPQYTTSTVIPASRYVKSMWNAFDSAWHAQCSEPHLRYLPGDLHPYSESEPAYARMLTSEWDTSAAALDGRRLPGWKPSLMGRGSLEPVPMPKPVPVSSMPDRPRHLKKIKDFVAAQYVVSQPRQKKPKPAKAAVHATSETAGPGPLNMASAQDIATAQGGFTPGERNDQTLSLVQFCIAHGYDLAFSEEVFLARWNLGRTTTPTAKAIHAFRLAYRRWQQKYRPPALRQVDTAAIRLKVDALLNSIGSLAPQRRPTRRRVADILVHIICDSLADPRTWSCRLLPDSYLMRVGQINGSCRRIPNRVKQTLRSIGCQSLTPTEAQRRLAAIQSHLRVRAAHFWDLRPLADAIDP